MIKCTYHNGFIPSFGVVKIYKDTDNQDKAFAMYLDEVEARELRDFLNEKFDCEVQNVEMAD